MKRMKMLAVALATGILTLSLFGCAAQDPQAPASGPAPQAEPMTAVELAGEMAAAAEGKNMTRAKGVTAFDMSITAQGETMDISIESATDVIMALDPYGTYTRTESVMSFSGEESAETTEQYILMEDGALVAYTYMESLGQWVKMDLEMDMNELMARSPEYNWLSEKGAGELELEEGTQAVSGREAYVLRTTLTGAEMERALGNIDALSSLAALGVGEMDFSSLSVAAVYYVDAETFLPIAFDMEMQGLAGMIKDVMAGAMGADAEGLELEFDISPIRLSYSDIGYDPAEVPAVPDEAVQSAFVAE